MGTTPRATNAATTRLLVNVAGLVAREIEALAGPGDETPLAPKVSAPSTNQLRQLWLDDILRSHVLLSLPLLFSIFPVASYFARLCLTSSTSTPDNKGKHANLNSDECGSSAARCLSLRLQQPTSAAHLGLLFFMQPTLVP